MTTTSPQTSPPDLNKPVEKIPPLVHLACGWPLVMVAIGGAIGGGLGGAAYGINMGVYKSKLPLVVKVILNPIVGAAAIGLWYVVATSFRG